MYVMRRPLARLDCMSTQSTAITIRQVDGLTRSLGLVRPRLTIWNVTKRFPIHILPNLEYDMLLGIDAGIEFGLNIDLKAVKSKVNRRPSCRYMYGRSLVHVASEADQQIHRQPNDQFDGFSTIIDHLTVAIIDNKFASTRTTTEQHGSVDSTHGLEHTIAIRVIVY